MEDSVSWMNRKRAFSIATILFHSLNFPADVPACLFEVFQCLSFETGTPQILDGVSDVEVETLRDVDALDAA